VQVCVCVCERVYDLHGCEYIPYIQMYVRMYLGTVRLDCDSSSPISDPRLLNNIDFSYSNPSLGTLMPQFALALFVRACACVYVCVCKCVLACLCVCVCCVSVFSASFVCSYSFAHSAFILDSLQFIDFCNCVR